MDIIKPQVELAIEAMKEFQIMGDPEIAHDGADKILCQILLAYGEKELVKEYLKVPKWYA